MSYENLYINNISIYNPDFHLVQEFNFSPSKKIVHRDSYGEYLGLNNSQVLFLDRKQIYLFDNHHKIIQAFLEYSEITGEGFDVVHIDAHNDDAVFPVEKPHQLEIRDVQKYIDQTLISDFFDFMSDASLQGEDCAELDSVKQSQKLIKKIHRYTKSTDFKEFKKPKIPYIVSLDIDIFGPEGDFVDLESKVRIIAEAWSDADVVCIAMSPGFINRDYAQEIIKIFTKH